MEQRKILIVDDDPNIREVLSVLLRSEGYIVEQAENGKDALEILHEDTTIDLVILDIMMPGMSGYQVCKKIRENMPVPILFLTAKSQDHDKIEAYTDGGDDYLVKPFSQTELLMKVKSLLRRYKEYSKGIYNDEQLKALLSENISLDYRSRSALKDGEKIGLTDKEFTIMQYFLEHRGEIVENKDLYEAVWNEKYLPSAGNTIMVHILNLRKKLEEDVNKPKLIKTIWGKGYTID